MSTWYISSTGSDTTGNGSFGSPYATVGKCITVGNNGDTIKALTGTYTITSTTNVTKQITVTSNSGVKTDVVFNSNCTIFNIQHSGVSITYVTLQTSSIDPLVTVDRMSTGTTVPTFWTDINISNCDIKYVTNGLSLNGTFTISSNTFTRNSGSNVVTIFTIYSTRGSCSISSNTFTDSGPVQYILYFTQNGSGSYLDHCNSKGGTLTIASNNITFTNDTQLTKFMHCDYFNQYTFVTSPTEQYNLNTRLVLNINNNNIALSARSIFINILISNPGDLDMFGSSNINTNVFNNTEYGAIHLDKNTSSHNVVIINSDILNRSVFKLYNNTLDTPFIGTRVLWYDVSDTSTLYQDAALTTPITGSGQTVRGITNKGSTVDTLTGAGSVIYYTGQYKSGTMPCLRFMSNGEVMTSMYNSHIEPTVGFTTIMLFGARTGYGYSNHRLPWGPSDTNDSIVYNTPTHYLKISAGYTGNGQMMAAPSLTVNDNKPHILVIVGNATAGTTTVYIDAAMTVLNTGTYSGTLFTNGTRYMPGTYGSHEQFAVCELMVYNTPLSYEAINTLVTSLKTKWDTY